MKFNFFKKNWGKKEDKEKKEQEEKLQSEKAIQIESGEFYFRLYPLFTEKSLLSARQGKYTFLTDPQVNKTQIKSAIEKMFKVKVIKVNTISYQKRLRGKNLRIKTKRPKFKKVIVQLQEGQRIPLFE